MAIGGGLGPGGGSWTASPCRSAAGGRRLDCSDGDRGGGEAFLPGEAAALRGDGIFFVRGGESLRGDGIFFVRGGSSSLRSNDRGRFRGDGVCLCGESLCGGGDRRRAAPAVGEGVRVASGWTAEHVLAYSCSRDYP